MLRIKAGKKNRTINHGLQLVRHILNLAATEWRDEHGLTWLLTAPKIKLLPELDLRKPYPLSWEEQARLLENLPKHLQQMALFAVNTGCRDQEICHLRWEWEIPLKDSSVFIIPANFVKNREDRLVVLNHVAKEVIEEVRGQHPEYVFTYKGKKLARILSTGWRDARVVAGLPTVRVHDLKHTFGRRLRASGVSFEDRQDLLGHRSGRITTHYSTAELGNLIAAANKVTQKGESGTILAMLKKISPVQHTRAQPKNLVALQPNLTVEKQMISPLGPTNSPQGVFLNVVNLAERLATIGGPTRTRT